MENIWFLAALWVGLALVATLVAIWLGVSTALSEIVVGTVAQLVIGVVLGGTGLAGQTQWITFLAGTGAIVLTFLAGAELDPSVFRFKWKEATVVGLVGFFAPFFGCAAVAYYILGWDLASLAGRSSAVDHLRGRGLCGDARARLQHYGVRQGHPGRLFHQRPRHGHWRWVSSSRHLPGVHSSSSWCPSLCSLSCHSSRPDSFGATAAASRSSKPSTFCWRSSAWAGSRCGRTASRSCPPISSGWCSQGRVGKDHVLIRRLRTLTFGLLTPFYFIRAGSFVSVPALIAAPGVFGALFLAKMVSKVCGVFPSVRFFGHRQGADVYYTLMMSTGLTFGTISALFGLNHGIITPAQYSHLVAAVIGSAVIPTLIANAFFMPRHLLSAAALDPGNGTGEARAPEVSTS